jgi:hypothetical protein
MEKKSAIGPADIPQRLGQICIRAPITQIRTRNKRTVHGML